jgi:hypothetical protein
MPKRGLGTVRSPSTIQRTLGYWPCKHDLSQLSHHRRLAMDRYGAWHARRRRGLWRCRLPFSVMPIAVTLWYMSMDLAPFLQTYLTGNLDPNNPKLSYEQQQNLWKSYWVLRQWVSVAVGLVIVSGAIALDIGARSRRDYAFWLHLAGVTAFWGGLSSMSSDSEVGKFIYFLINVAMLMFGAVIGRRVYTVFGALGIAGYLGHLSHKVFKDSLVFPVALMLIGLGVVWLGVIWQRHEAAIDSALQRWLQERLRRTPRQA